MNRFLQGLGLFTLLVGIYYGIDYLIENHLTILNNIIYAVGIITIISQLIIGGLRLRHGRNWLTKSWISFMIGNGLMSATNNFINELRAGNLQQETIIEVGLHIFWRFTRIGLFATLLAAIPIALLWRQNELVSSQNRKIDIQNNLMEAERRSSLVFLMSNILDKVDDEIKEQRDSLKKVPGINLDSVRYRLSKPLINRIVGLSRAFRPYQIMDGKELSTDTISPERGQLFIALMENKLDSLTQNTIAEDGNFSNAIIGEINLNKANLSYANLSYANLRVAFLIGADLRVADLRGADLIGADLRGADLIGADLRGAFLIEADLRGADLSYADLRVADLIGADLRGADLRGADLSYADFSRIRNIIVDQLKSVKTLYQCKNLAPQLEQQLRKEKPCLFEDPDGPNACPD